LDFMWPGNACCQFEVFDIVGLKHRTGRACSANCVMARAHQRYQCYQALFCLCFQTCVALCKTNATRSVVCLVNSPPQSSSRTFICCLSLELKSRFPNWLKPINRHTHVPCRCLNWHRTFSSAGYVGFTNQTRRVQSFWTICPDGTTHPSWIYRNTNRSSKAQVNRKNDTNAK
jgi:hypothetical protein